MEELIRSILTTGTKVVISEETVLGGVLKRPLVVNYVSDDGVVTETWEYTEPAESHSWGAIKSVSYALTSALEVNQLEVFTDINFCKTIKMKLLASLKSMPTLPQENYRAMSDLFWYAKDAADNGNPTNLRIELLALPDEATLGLTNWDVLRASLVNDIDTYLLQD